MLFSKDSQHTLVYSIERDCRTNEFGNGLWYDGQQTKGTMQFNLPTKRSSAYSKLRRELIKEHSE